MPLGDLAGGTALVLLALFYPLVSFESILFIARRPGQRLTQIWVLAMWAGYTWALTVVA